MARAATSMTWVIAHSTDVDVLTISNKAWSRPSFTTQPHSSSRASHPSARCRRLPLDGRTRQPCHHGPTCDGQRSSAHHRAPTIVRRTPGISCEAVPALTPAARAQGGTSACHTGAALSFVSFIPLLGGPSRAMQAGTDEIGGSPGSLETPPRCPAKVRRCSCRRRGETGRRT